MSNNVMLGFPNRADGATLSGGSWTAGLPLDNLKTRPLGDVARSSNLLLASTKFDVDLGQLYNIRLAGFVNHNLTLPALVRIRTSKVSDFSTVSYDSGWGEVWPVLYPFGTLAWEDESWWGGSYTPEEISGMETNCIRILPANAMVRYLRIEIDNTTNSAGFVDIGRLFVSPVWQPVLNMLNGNSLGWETKTDVQEALSGAEYFNVRTPYRVQRFELDYLTLDEAFTKAFELQRRAGVDREIFFIKDPSDTFHALRRRFMGRLRQLNPIEHPSVLRNKVAFEIKELI